ncbi:MAG: sulfatase-like hydrolase/transferase [bacterium]
MPDKPLNVVLTMSDQHRRDAAGCEGHPTVRTPHLDRLAAEGTRFTRAYAASPLCGPCRSAVMTGREVHRCGSVLGLLCETIELIVDAMNALEESLCLARLES